MPFAISQADSIIETVVQTLNPIDTSFKLSDIITAVSAGLAFLAPVAGVAGGVVEGAVSVASAVTDAIGGAQEVANIIWPSGTEESQTIQIADLHSKLGEQNLDWTKNLEAGLKAIMTDRKNFVNFAKSGKFSGDFSVSIPDNAENLGLALKTLIISKAFNGNGYTSLVSSHLNIVNAADDGVADCGSQALNADYSTDSTDFYLGYFTDVKKPGGDKASLLPHILGEWTTGTSLFEGSLNCARSGAGVSGNLVNIVDGKLDLSCMSQMLLCAHDSALGLSHVQLCNALGGWHQSRTKEEGSGDCNGQ